MQMTTPLPWDLCRKPRFILKDGAWRCCVLTPEGRAAMLYQEHWAAYWRTWNKPQVVAFLKKLNKEKHEQQRTIRSGRGL
jgi:hypothetical protein